jgi:hypothetical protein
MVGFIASVGIVYAIPQHPLADIAATKTVATRNSRIRV